jgi:hypothetical protein
MAASGRGGTQVDASGRECDASRGEWTRARREWTRARREGTRARREGTRARREGTRARREGTRVGREGTRVGREGRRVGRVGHLWWGAVGGRGVRDTAARATQQRGRHSRSLQPVTAAGHCSRSLQPVTAAGGGQRYAAHAVGPLPRERRGNCHPVPGTDGTTGWAEYQGRQTDPARRSAGWASRAFPAGLPPPDLPRSAGPLVLPGHRPGPPPAAG